MPWYNPEELKHFKETTANYPLIMGRKTHEAIGKVLPDRLNLVLSRNQTKSQDKNLKYFSDVETALNYCKSSKYQKVFIIGGAEVFEDTLDIAHEMVISHMNIDVAGDAFFPEIDLAKWKIISEKKHENFRIITYSVNQA